jgi:hypothetical protein
MAISATTASRLPGTSRPAASSHAYFRKNSATASIARRAARLVLVRSRPILFREGEPPLVRLFAMMRIDELPPDVCTWEEPPLVIRTVTGDIHSEYSAVKAAIGFHP